MVSHMSCIGFDVGSEEEFFELWRLSVMRAADAHGDRSTAYRADEGFYFRWDVGGGAQLWSQTTPDGDMMGMHPHFIGRAISRVGITSVVERPFDTPLDGAFYGWLDPDYDDDPESGLCPVVFDAPNARAIMDSIEIPGVYDVQLAAFPHSLEVYGSEREYYESQQEEPHSDSGFFIPSGTFKPGGGLIEPPHSEAIFAGVVQEYKLIENESTGRKFHHARVKTRGGEIDVVVDCDAPMKSVPEKDSVVTGMFWLSGLLMKPSEAR